MNSDGRRLKTQIKTEFPLCLSAFILFICGWIFLFLVVKMTGLGVPARIRDTRGGTPIPVILRIFNRR